MTVSEPTISTTDGAVHLERHGEHVVAITFTNPPSNTLTWEGRSQLRELLASLQDDLSVRCVVLTGQGRIFTAGADLREDGEMTEDQLDAFAADFGSLLLAIEELRVPVVAAINGAAIGGGLELALACDLRLASEDAIFVAAGVNVGLIANFWRLPRITGLGPAKEMLLTGDRYTAEQARTWGLVSSVHPGEELHEAALAKAQRIASRAPLSVEATKACVNRALELDYDEGRALQVENFKRVFQTKDHKEALKAFFDRRDGDFQRR